MHFNFFVLQKSLQSPGRKQFSKAALTSNKLERFKFYSEILFQIVGGFLESQFVLASKQLKLDLIVIFYGHGSHTWNRKRNCHVCDVFIKQ
jgi:hypothetical protein